MIEGSRSKNFPYGLVHQDVIEATQESSPERGFERVAGTSHGPAPLSAPEPLELMA